jgi:hypothetical protein
MFDDLALIPAVDEGQRVDGVRALGRAPVSVMEFEDGKRCYITLGHVDLKTALLRGRYVEWEYPPQETCPIWLIEIPDVGATYALEPIEGGIPATAILGAENPVRHETTDRSAEGAD